MSSASLCSECLYSSDPFYLRILLKVIGNFPPSPGLLMWSVWVGSFTSSCTCVKVSNSSLLNYEWIQSCWHSWDVLEVQVDLKVLTFLACVWISLRVLSNILIFTVHYLHPDMKLPFRVAFLWWLLLIKM